MIEDEVSKNTTQVAAAPAAELEAAMADASQLAVATGDLSRTISPANNKLVFRFEKSTGELQVLGGSGDWHYVDLSHKTVVAPVTPGENITIVLKGATNAGDEFVPKISSIKIEYPGRRKNDTNRTAAAGKDAEFPIGVTVHCKHRPYVQVAFFAAGGVGGVDKYSGDPLVILVPKPGSCNST